MEVCIVFRIAQTELNICFTCQYVIYNYKVYKSNILMMNDKVTENGILS